MSRETLSVVPATQEVAAERSVVREDLTPARYRLLVSPTVLATLGGEQAVRTALTGMAPSYRCACCRNEGRLDRGQCASLVVLINEDPAAPDTGSEPRLAHPGCSDSLVRRTPVPGPSQGCPTLPGTVWLRPADADPAAVVVLTVPASSAYQLWEDGFSKTLSPALSAHGFVALTEVEGRLPRSRSLTAWYAAGRVTVQDRFGRLVWSGPLPAPHAWTFAALRTREIGLVLAAVEPSGHGSQLPDAIAAGQAVGVAVRLRDPAIMGDVLPTRRASALGIRQFRLPAQRPRIPEYAGAFGGTLDSVIGSGFCTGASAGFDGGFGGIPAPEAASAA